MTGSDNLWAAQVGRRFHVLAASVRFEAKCGAQVEISDAQRPLPLEQVPTILRCKRLGCRPHWPNP